MWGDEDNNHNQQQNSANDQWGAEPEPQADEGGWGEKEADNRGSVGEGGGGGGWGEEDSGAKPKKQFTQEIKPTPFIKTSDSKNKAPPPPPETDAWGDSPVKPKEDEGGGWGDNDDDQTTKPQLSDD